MCLQFGELVGQFTGVKEYRQQFIGHSQVAESAGDMTAGEHSCHRDLLESVASRF